MSNSKIAELLYTHHKQFDTENHDGITPSMLSILVHNFQVTETLMKHGANILYKNLNSLSVIDMVI